MQKFGVVNNRERKSGPVVKEGVEKVKRFSKRVTCACGRSFIKECPSEDMCEVSTHTCPHCGAVIR